MISERDEDRKDERRPLVVSFVASLVLTPIVWILATWGFTLHLKIPTIEPKEREYIVSSSSIQIEKRQPVPQPPHPQTPPQRAALPQQRVTPTRPIQRHRVQPSPRPTEIARIVPHAPPQERVQKPGREPSSLASQLAQQEQMFSKEAQQLNAQRAPLSIATNPPQPPSSFHRSYLDLNGRDQRESVEAVLEPIPHQHWYANGMSCYYVHYYAQYSGGGSEEGNIPWPLCYPADHDAMLPLDRSHRLPIPAPPAGYVLPAGTTLQPLLQAIYTHKIENDR